MSDACRIRAVIAEDAPMVLSWRNHPSIRNVMLTRHEIGLEEHQRWFERASADPTRQLLIIEAEDGPIGYAQFSNVAEGSVADWGFYARPDAPRGSGRKLGTAALNHAFYTLNLHKVCGQAIDINQASIALHARLGFVREGVLRDQHYLDGVYHSLVCFGLLKHEWQPD